MTRIDSNSWIPSTIRQFWILARNGLSWRTVLFNRFTIILVAIVLITAGAQAYVNTNDSGVISGQVVDEEGDPVADVTVVIEKVDLKNQVGRQTQTTDSTGQFRFSDANVLEFRIYAQNDKTKSNVHQIHLYYRGQPRQVTLVLNQSAK